MPGVGSLEKFMPVHSFEWCPPWITVPTIENGSPLGDASLEHFAKSVLIK